MLTLAEGIYKNWISIVPKTSMLLGLLLRAAQEVLIGCFMYILYTKAAMLPDLSP